MASGAYPFLSSIKSTDFLKALSIGEMVVGATLLAPFVPPAVAGAALPVAYFGICQRTELL